MNLTHYLSVLGPASDGALPASARAIIEVPAGAFSFFVVGFVEETRTVLASAAMQIGIWDGTNEWNIGNYFAANVRYGAMRFATDQHTWFVRPTAALPLGQHLRVFLAFDLLG